MSKHEEILKYIEGLDVGKKVSVRSIANRMSVADGTAYRAIKEAENRGLVAVTERSGTVRVPSKDNKVKGNLTFGKLAEIAHAEVLGGRAGLEVEFNQFVISAMTMESFKRYLSPYGLVICGDRQNIQELSLRESNAVLVTGGFDIEQSVIDYANLMGIPLLRTTYDTFTVASRISHALSNQLIKKDIPTVADIFHQIRPTLGEEDTVKDFSDLSRKVNLSRFAVLNRYNVVVGVIAMRDIDGKPSDTPINKLMNTPDLAMLDMTIASVSQKMIQQGYDMMPVVRNDHTYAGVISKADLLAALQKSQEETQVTHTFSDDLSTRLKERGSSYQIMIEPFMINATGNVANGIFAELGMLVTRRVMEKRQRRNILIESMTQHFFGSAQIDHVLELYPKVIGETRRSAMIDLEIYHASTIVAKILISLQQS